MTTSKVDGETCVRLLKHYLNPRRITIILLSVTLVLGIIALSVQLNGLPLVSAYFLDVSPQEELKQQEML